MMPIENPSLVRKRPNNLAQGVVDALTQRILLGQLKPGEKLPSESTIVLEHGVSRTVVREAISKLQASGLVETRHGIGTFVLEPHAQQGLRFMWTPSPACVTCSNCAWALRCRLWRWPPCAGVTSNWRACARR